MKRIFQKIAILLCIVFILPAIIGCIPSMHLTNKAEAAEQTMKPTLYSTEASIGISSTPEYVYVDYTNAKATYTYTSSNTKVVTVDKFGELSGVSLGKASITVKEVYNGKSSVVGVFQVSVVKSKLESDTITLIRSDPKRAPIIYQNYKAKYTFVSSDPTIVTVNKDNLLVGLKKGDTTVTVTEINKNAKRVLGSFTVTVIESSIADGSSSLDLGINNTVDPMNVILINNQSWSAKYSYKSEDNSIAFVTKTNDQWGSPCTRISGVKEGTTKITVYEEYEGNTRTVGTVQVNVKNIPVTHFLLDPRSTTYNGKMIIYCNLSDGYCPNLNDFLVKAPINTNTPVTFASGNTAILTVDNEGKVTPVKAGTTEVTATCGSFTAKIQIIVSQ